jgi:hypothetical protein
VKTKLNFYDIVSLYFLWTSVDYKELKNYPKYNTPRFFDYEYPELSMMVEEILRTKRSRRFQFFYDFDGFVDFIIENVDIETVVKYDLYGEGREKISLDRWR